MTDPLITHSLRVDAEVVRYRERLRRAFAVRSTDRVLDIGCGTGSTTRDAATAARHGSAVGVDIATPVVEVARRLAAEDGIDNVTFVPADAETHPFPSAHYDRAISRFGTMFFGDPAAAFANIARALRPGAPLVQLVWQPRDQQEWATAISAALTGERPPPPPTGPNAFSLADPATVTDLLTAAGFTDITSTALNEPVYYGPLAEAYEFAHSLMMTQELLATADAPDQARARLRAMLSERDTGDGVWFGSQARLVTAHRR